jgi:hypothetical protein
MTVILVHSSDIPAGVRGHARKLKALVLGRLIARGDAKI